MSRKRYRPEETIAKRTDFIVRIVHDVYGVHWHGLSGGAARAIRKGLGGVICR
jgi:hypothetical protein